MIQAGPDPSTNVLCFPTTRKARYKSPTISQARHWKTGVPKNVELIWDKARERQEAIDSELITVEITRGLYKAIKRMESLNGGQA